MNITLTDQQALDFIAGLICGSTKMTIPDKDSYDVSITIPGPIPPGDVLQQYVSPMLAEGFYLMFTSDTDTEFSPSYMTKCMLGYDGRSLFSPEVNKIRLCMQPVDEAAAMYTDAMLQQRAVWESVEVIMNEHVTDYSPSDLEDQIFEFHKEKDYPPPPPNSVVIANPGIYIELTFDAPFRLPARRTVASKEECELELFQVNFTLTTERTLCLTNALGMEQDFVIPCRWDRFGFRHMSYSNTWITNTTDPNAAKYRLQQMFTMSVCYYGSAFVFYPSSLQMRGYYLDYNTYPYQGWYLKRYYFTVWEKITAAVEFIFVSIIGIFFALTDAIIEFFFGENKLTVKVHAGENQIMECLPIEVAGSAANDSEQLAEGVKQTFGYRVIEPANASSSDYYFSSLTVGVVDSPVNTHVPTQRKEIKEKAQLNDRAVYLLQGGGGEQPIITEHLQLTDDAKYSIKRTVLKQIEEQCVLTDDVRYGIIRTIEKTLPEELVLTDDAKYIIVNKTAKKLLSKLYLRDDVRTAMSFTLTQSINEQLNSLGDNVLQNE